VCLRAQDPFEIQVYEYETVPKGMWSLETHTNFTFQGSKDTNGTVAASNNQFHLTYELTRGITEHFEMAGYLLLSRRPGTPGSGFEYAGAHIRPRYSIPESVGLPVKVSISLEIGWPVKQYETNSITMELRPILERSFGRFQFDFNPTVNKGLRGPVGPKYWEFEPSARVGYEVNKKLDISFEYYGATGRVFHPDTLDEQAHILTPGFDWKFRENMAVNVGFGFAATSGGNQLVLKTRLSYEFGKKKT
jgi:hypothetical protein